MRPRATKVKPLDDYRLLITFGSSENRVFDVNPYFDFTPFKELKDNDLFRRVYIAGLSVEWPNGVDICPDELYYDSIPLEETCTADGNRGDRFRY